MDKKEVVTFLSFLLGKRVRSVAEQWFVSKWLLGTKYFRNLECLMGGEEFAGFVNGVGYQLFPKDKILFSPGQDHLASYLLLTGKVSLTSKGLLLPTRSQLTQPKHTFIPATLLPRRFPTLQKNIQKSTVYHKTIKYLFAKHSTEDLCRRKHYQIINSK